MTVTLLAAAAFVALLELDVASVGQFMLGRPLVAGTLLGVALGEATLGAGLGALFELFSLGELPVGGKVPLNGTVGVGAAFLLAAREGLPVEAAFALGVACAALHGRLEKLLRGVRAGIGPRLGLQTAGTFALVAAALGLRGLDVPEPVAGGLRFGLTLAPWIGAAAALTAVRGHA